MNRREQRAAERRLTPRDRTELLQKLGDQRQLLRHHAATYDADPANTVLSLPLATTIRVLVHDSGASFSLLGQLGLKASLRFLDTAAPLTSLPPEMKASLGFVSLEIAREGRGMRWVAPLGAVPENRQGRSAPFQPWWEVDCHRDGLGNTWSRRDFVLYLANKEGGAHVDGRQREERFQSLERENSMGWSLDHSEAGHFDSGSPVPASVRQIAHELLATLEALQPAA